MHTHTIGIVMNGIAERTGLKHHLIRSVPAIRGLRLELAELGVGRSEKTAAIDLPSLED